MRFKKIIASVLTLSVIAASAGCASKDEKNTKIIQQVTTDFFDALVNEDTDRIEELTDGLEFESSLELMRDYLGDNYDIFQRFLSYTEVVEMDEVEFDYDHGEAEMKTTFSFLNIIGLYDYIEADSCTHDELMELIDEHGECQNKTFNLEFEYDEDSGEWYMNKKSAEKVINFLGTKVNSFPIIVNISQSDARAMFEDFLNTLAETGTYDDVMVDLDAENFRVYENVVDRGEGPNTQEAIDEFVAAYVSYILAHDYTIDEPTPYHYILTGSAPSADDIYEQLSAPEFFYAYYREDLRYSYLGESYEDMWDNKSAHLYSWLAQAITFAGPEDYILSANVDPFGAEDGVLTISSDLITEPDRGLYEAEHGLAWDDFEAVVSAAAESLHLDGEMSDDIYDAFIDGLTPENYGYASSGADSSSGHPDQAVGTYEQVPSWCEDGSLVYGYSNPDENGFWMFYSKEPGYLDTVGYYIGDGGIWITNYYDCEFNSGDILEVDWWVDGVQVIDALTVNIREDGTTEVEVCLPVDDIDDISEIEMRLWEEGHQHVISYVTLTHN